MDDVEDARIRARLAELAARDGDTLRGLSMLLGRNEAYLQQFVARGTPRRLAEDDRLFLAKRFLIDERELGARDPWSPA